MKQLDATTINFAVMDLVIETARRAVESSNCLNRQAWLNAITNAAEELRANPFWYFESGVLVLVSETSGNTYEIQRDGKHSGCGAFDNHKPCKHRCLRKLVDNYQTALAFPQMEAGAPRNIFETTKYPLPATGIVTAVEAVLVGTMTREQIKREHKSENHRFDDPAKSTAIYFIDCHYGAFIGRALTVRDALQNLVLRFEKEAVPVVRFEGATPKPAQPDHNCKLCFKPLKNSEHDIHTLCGLYESHSDEIIALAEQVKTEREVFKFRSNNLGERYGKYQI